MSKGITTVLPSGNRFTYVPRYAIYHVHGKYSAILQNGREAGVVITDTKGKQTFRANSHYPHITPMQLYCLSVLVCIWYREEIEIAVDEASNGFLNTRLIHLLITLVPIANTIFSLAALRDYFYGVYTKLKLRYTIWKLKRKLSKLKEPLRSELIELIDQL